MPLILASRAQGRAHRDAVLQQTDCICCLLKSRSKFSAQAAKKRWAAVVPPCPPFPAKDWGATGGLQEELGMVGLEGSGSLLSQENAISFPL